VWTYAADAGARALDAGRKGSGERPAGGDGVPVGGWRSQVEERKLKQELREAEVGLKQSKTKDCNNKILAGATRRCRCRRTCTLCYQ